METFCCREALGIILSGQEQLSIQSRADMEDFVPVQEHLDQPEKYEQCFLTETESNRAVAEKRSYFDKQ